MIETMIKESKKDKKNGSNGGSGVPTPSGGVQTPIKTEPQTPDPLTANAGTTVPSVSVKEEPNATNSDSMNSCENSGSNNCGVQGGPQPVVGPDIKPNVCGPGGGMNPMMGPNGVVGNNPMDNFLSEHSLDMKPGGGDMGPDSCGPMMGQIKMEDQMGPGHDFGNMGDPMGGPMGPMNPMMGGNMGDMGAHKQPSTLDAQYMQQQSQIFVFSTQLANEAAEAVMHGQCPSIIAYHCSQPGTKKFLEKHPLKINQFSRNSSQILANLAMKKGPPMGRGMGFGGPSMVGGGGNMMSDFMSGGPGGPMGPNGPMGPGMGGWNQGNCDSMPGMGPVTPGGMGPRMGMPGSMGPGMMPCCPMPHGNMVPCGPGSGPPCSQSGPMGMSSKSQMEGNMMSPLPSGSPMMPGGPQNRPGPGSMGGMMGPGNMQMNSAMAGMNKDLLGVKIPDENLTPQQMQHRAEKLAKMKIMKQMLFPEHGQGGPEGMGPMNPGNGSSPCPPGGPGMMGPGMMNPMNQGPGGMNQGGGPMMGMPMMGNKMMNMGPDGPNMMPGPGSGLNSASAQMEWQKLQAQFFEEQRKKKGSGPGPGMMMSGMGPMGQGGMGPMGQGGMGPMGQGGMSPMQMGSPGGPMGMMGPGGMPMGMMGPMGGPRMGGPAGVRMQGPPPPYPQGQRSGSASGGPMPSPLQSQGPPSPPLSLPSPRNNANMESPADRGFNQRLSGNMGPASAPGHSPSGILNTPLDSPNPGGNQPRPMGNMSNPGTPVTGPGPPHISPGMRKDSMVPDFSSSVGGMLGGMNNPNSGPGDMYGRPMQQFPGQMQQSQQNVQAPQKVQNNMSGSGKEPNLMPVPSPQQIQYLTPFEGQELTIQKQPNTSLRESDLMSPSMPASSVDSGLPSSSEMQGSRMSAGPNTPTTPSSTADNPPPRYSGSQTPHTPSGNYPAPSPGGPPTSQSNSGSSNDKNQRFPGPSPQVQGGPKTPANDSVQNSDNVINKYSAPSPQAGNQNMDNNDFSRFTSQSSNQSQNRISTSPLFDVSPPKMSDIGFGGPPDNVPINPGNGMGGPMGSKMFDPISSMAQMSQQLTNTVGPGMGPNSPPIITSMAPTNQGMTFSSAGPGGMGMPSQMGVGMVNFNSSMASMQGMQQMGDGPMMGGGPGGAQTVNNTYVSATMNIQQMNIQSMHGGSYNPMMQGPNPMMSGDPNMMKGGMPPNHMMMGGPQRGMGPNGPYPSIGPGGPQQMMGPGPMVQQRMMAPNSQMNRPGSGMPGPYNGANVQVKASAPNTIQYLPSRPQTANPSPRGPPRLDFLPTFSGGPMDSKGGGPQGMSFYPGGANSGSGGGMPMNMMGPNGPGNQNMQGGGPMSMSGGMGSMPMNMGGGNPMMGMSGPMGNSGPGGSSMGSMPMGNMMGGPGGNGMGPNGPMSMSMPGGPMGPGPNMNMMPSNMSMSMSSQGMSMGGPRTNDSGQMMRGQMIRPQQMGGMYQGPGGPMPNEPMFMSGNGPMPMNPGGQNPMMMPGNGGFSGGKQSQMGPDPSQPMNGPGRGSYMGPSAADPNYAQQFHNFQQQLYATNNRNQMGNPNMGMAGQSFFGPK